MNEFDTSSYMFPLYSDNKLDAILPLADFISKKVISTKYVLKTSSDVEEKIDTISNLLICETAISLLHLSYTTGDASLIDKAKDICRGL
jgi:hypothetical protein